MFNRVVVGIATATALALVPAAAHADTPFELVPGSFYTTPSSDQAGGHPDFTTNFDIARDPVTDQTSGSPKDLNVSLPPGFVGNVTTTPQCTMDKVAQYDITKACPANTIVGTAEVVTAFPGFSGSTLNVTTPVYNVKPYSDEPAAFAMGPLQNAVRLDTSVRSDSDYGIDVSLNNITEKILIMSAKVTLYGVPADHNGPGPLSDIFGVARTWGGPSGDKRVPLLTNGTACDGQARVSALSLTQWQDASVRLTDKYAGNPLTGCDQLTFDPSIDVKPVTTAAGQPSGLHVELAVPQNDDPDGLATPALRNATVTLPQGMAISASAASGLNACTDAQLGLRAKRADVCPLDSKIGTVVIDTPLLNDPLEGSLYIGEQLSDDPESGQMYRLFLTAEGAGVRVKLLGQIRADKATGQLTASFADNPQLPFSKLTLSFKGGDRAILANPLTCGTYETKASLSSWGGQHSSASSSFVIDQGCPTGQFAPGFTAGTTQPFAGGFSPFTMTVTRSDADQDLSSIRLDLPSGLLGALAGVPLCGDAQAAAGACDPSSRIGSTTVSVGAGGAPFSLPGTVYLGGPYKGAPLSLSVAVPAKAGPYDLGLVVVRAALHIDPTSARASAVTDPFPTIVGGVPIRLRMVNVTLDRPRFMFNPTSCDEQSVAAGLQSVAGASAQVASRFAVSGCASLELRSKLTMGLSGKGQTTDGKHPALSAKLTQLWTGQANLRTAQVKLPLSLALDPDNANGLCEPTDAAANRCPASSIVGHAKALSPILAGQLSGPVYFVRGERRDPRSGRIIKTLPKLYVPLTASDYPGLRIDLHANSEVDEKDARLVTTFDQIPDAPVSDFWLDITGGEHGILVVSDTDICKSTQVAAATFTGQSRKVLRYGTSVSTPCKLGVVASSHTSKALRVTVGGIGAGKVTVSGKGLKTTSRKISVATAATLSVPLSKATRARLAKHRNVKVKVTAAFAPQGKKIVKTTKTLIIHGAKSTTKK